MRLTAEKWDFMKLKGFCPAKGTVRRMKEWLTKGKKIFASYSSDTLVCRIY